MQTNGRSTSSNKILLQSASKNGSKEQNYILPQLKVESSIHDGSAMLHSGEAFSDTSSISNIQCEGGVVEKIELYNGISNGVKTENISNGVKKTEDISNENISNGGGITASKLDTDTNTSTSL